MIGRARVYGERAVYLLREHDAEELMREYHRQIAEREREIAEETRRETVKLRDFLRVGVPFTLSAVLAGYIYIWLVWGI